MIKIALADDHKLFAKGLVGMLEEHPKFRVVGTFPNGNELLEFLKSQQVDVVLTDLNMPMVNGFEVLKYCKENYPEVKVVILSMYDDEKIFKEVFDLGADGFILKDAEPEDLVFTIIEVFNGRTALNFSRVIHEIDHSKFFDAFRIKFKLSKRETQIIKMIGDGMVNKDIAKSLNLSIQTIETHRKNINHKLQVKSLMDLVRKVNEITILFRSENVL
jgi:DNA-binding NarL/FixJ family response regulator